MGNQLNLLYVVTLYLRCKFSGHDPDDAESPVTQQRGKFF